MELEVTRNSCRATCTIGKLYVDGHDTCFTLEDVVRPDGVKVYGETAIPAGRYQVTITFSNRFQRLLPLINDVPMFSGIRIHPGNTDKDTHGCLLVGEEVSGDMLLHSRAAFEPLFTQIQNAIHDGEGVWLTITEA